MKTSIVRKDTVKQVHHMVEMALKLNINRG